MICVGPSFLGYGSEERMEFWHADYNRICGQFRHCLDKKMGFQAGIKHFHLPQYC